MAITLINLGSPTPGPDQPGADSHYTANSKNNANATDLDNRLGGVEAGAQPSRTLSATDTVVAADAGKMLESPNTSSACTLTVPAGLNWTNANVAGVRRRSTGTFTLAPGSGVTFLSTASVFTLRAPYSSGSIQKVPGTTDTYYVDGDFG